MDEIWAHVGISPLGAVSVVISSTVLYLVYASLLRFFGQRLYVGVSTFSVALVALVGAVTARATLGDSPTLLGGLVALGTLLALESAFGSWSRHFPRARLRFRRSPVVLMVGRQVCVDELKKHHLSETQLWSRLRQKGIVNRSQVGVVILEPSGSLTVLRAGAHYDPTLLRGVKGIEPVLDAAASIADRERRVDDSGPVAPA